MGAEMPFAKVAGAVAVVAEDVGHRRFVVAEHVAAGDGAPAADAVRIAPRHQRRARRCAVAVDVKIAEAHRLVVQSIEVGRLDHGIAVAAEVAVTLVIGNEHDDVGLGRGDGRGGQRSEQQGGQEGTAGPPGMELRTRTHW